MKFKDHFSSRSQDYAAYRPTYPPELAAFIAAIAPSRQCVWDCGCGNGQLSRLLAHEFESVIATDPSPEQLSKAGVDPKIDYLCEPAEKTSQADGSVDVVTVAQAAHWFDLDTFYKEVRRVGKTGTIVALITYGVIEAEGPPAHALEVLYWSKIGPYWPPERKLVEEGYRTLPFPFEELDPPSFAMTADWNLHQLIGYCDTWSATRAMEKAVGRDAVERAFGELSESWGDPEMCRPVRWPLSMRLGKLT